MPELATARARAGLARLQALGLAGARSEAALDALVARMPRCQAVVYELVLGDGHPGEVDFGVRLLPEQMEAVLAEEPGLRDWRELAVLEPSRGWVERDTGAENPPLSVFAQFRETRHASELARVLRRLGVAPFPLPRGVALRHLGVLHGRAEREVRVVVEGEDMLGLARTLGFGELAVPAGRHQLAAGLGADGLHARFGVERVQRREAGLPDVAMTPAQRQILSEWGSLPGGVISHLKWVAPDGVVKAYLSLG